MAGSNPRRRTGASLRRANPSPPPSLVILGQRLTIHCECQRSAPSGEPSLSREVRSAKVSSLGARPAIANKARHREEA